MILYREDKTNIAQENCMMLEVEGGGYVYLSKNVYDQAILLADRYEGNLSILINKLDMGDRHEDAVEYFSEVAPEPLDMLAPFLALAAENAELEQDIKELCGVLHQMAMAVNFSEIVRVPKEVRVQASFSNRFLHKYEESWESIETKLIVTDVDIDQVKLSAIEALLKRVLPLMGPSVETVQLNAAPVAVQTVTTPPSVETVPVAVDEPGAKKVITTVDELDEVDFFAPFNYLTKEKQPPKTVSAEQIAESMGKGEKNLEEKKAVMDEAEKVKALVSKFGGA